MKKAIKIIAGALVGLLVFSIIWSASQDQAEKEMVNIEKQVANDAEQQYYIAKKGGDKMDIYVHAGLVAASYLQAKDEINYKKWKEIEKKEAKAAGIRR